MKGELLVGFSDKENIQKTIKLLETNDGVSFIKMLMESGDTQIAHFKVPVGEEEKYIKIFNKTPNVKYAEVNKIASTQPIISTEDIISTDKQIVVLKVNSDKVACDGIHGKQDCLQIKELGVHRKWQNQFENIEGFEYQPGFVYNLQVEKFRLKNPPQDASSIHYKLLKVVKKEKPITDEMMSSYATLTVTKIENGKDGYTATLKNDKGDLFVSTISIPNLEDNYVSLKVGDKVKIAGDYAEGNPVQIYAKRILKA